MTDNSPHGNVSYVAGGTDSGIRKFRRSSSDRMVAGVCGGAAELLGIESSLVRVLLVIATLLGFGSGILIYLACWIIVPEK
jgi:phage shock protein C